MTRTSQLSLFAALALILSLPGVALSAPSHAHSDYVRALQDLRLARVMLQRTGIAEPGIEQTDEAKLAIVSIDGAIAEIDGAAVVDGAIRSDIPQIDPRLQWKKRLVKSLELLDRAEQECGIQKNDSGVKDLQARVSAQIDAARTRVRVAIETVNFNYDQVAVIR